jgi:hypothetical protein
MPNNMLYFGDNLDWLPKVDPESVDLIYLDSPFNSAASHICSISLPTAALPKSSSRHWRTLGPGDRGRTSATTTF